MKNKSNVALFNANTPVNYNKRYKMSGQYTNIAFISYKREDEKWAKWLQKKLEHYQLPTEIRKQNPNMEFAERPRHVFKDTTDMSGGVLEKAIQDGLSYSKFLIVICSPLAAKSPWVCKEVQYFIDSGREEYIIPFIIDGEPHSKDIEKECFPEALRSLAGEKELLGININENGRESAAVKVIAQMFNVRFDTLWQRFKKEQKKRRRYTIIGLVMLILLIASVAYHQNSINKELTIANVHAESSIAEELSAKGNLFQAQKILYEALSGREKYMDDVFESALRKAYNEYDSADYHCYNIINERLRVNSICVAKSHSYLAYGLKRRITILDANTMREKAELSHLGNSNCLEFDPSEKYLLCASSANLSTNDPYAIKIWKTDSFTLHDSIKVSSVESAAFVPNSNKICYCSHDTLVIYDIVKKKEILRIKEHDDHLIRKLAVSPDGQLVATVEYVEPTIKIWRISDGTLYGSLKGHDNTSRTMIWSCDSKRLISGSDDQTVAIWDINKRKIIKRLHFDHIINGLCLAQSDSLLLIGSDYDDNLYMYDFNTQSMRIMPNFENGIGDICFDSLNGIIYTKSHGHTIRVIKKSHKPTCKKLWDGYPSTKRFGNVVYEYNSRNSPPQILHSFDGESVNEGSETDLSIRYNVGYNCYISSNGKEVYWRNLTDGLETHIALPIDKILFPKVCSNNDGSIVFITGVHESMGVYKRVYYVYNFLSKTLIMSGELPDDISFSNIIIDDGSIYFGCDLGKIIEIDVHNKRFSTIAKMNDDVYRLCYSKSKRKIYAASKDWSGIIIDLSTQKSKLLMHEDEVRDISLSQDEQYILTASDNKVYVWAEETGNPIISYTVKDAMFRETYLDKDSLSAIDYRGRLYKWSFPKIHILLNKLKETHGQ